MTMDRTRLQDAPAFRHGGVAAVPETLRVTQAASAITCAAPGISDSTAA